jgi:uncharacterized protein YndB with AHSA1/START domain
MLTLTEILTATPDCVIQNTRVLPYNQQWVYHAWTNPDILQKWWGPKGFTNTFHEFNLVPGGKWLYTMHGPDTGNYPNESVCIDIQPGKQLVFHHQSPPAFYVVALFEAVNTTETRLIFKQVFESAEACAKIRPFATDKNEENIDRLETELAILAKTT